MEDKSNNELISLKKELEALHEAKKREAIRILDEMDSIQSDYNKINEILNIRLNNG